MSRVHENIAGRLLRYGMTMTFAALSFGTCASAAETASELTAAQLNNAEYQVSLFEKVKIKLRDGEYADPQQWMWLSLDTFASGDLNGDGRKDAAVILAANGGGSGTFMSLGTVLNEAGQPMQTASEDLGDRVVVKSIAIADGTITLTLVTHGPDDPMCCPTLKVMRTYRLDNGKLARVSETPLGKIKPETEPPR